MSTRGKIMDAVVAMLQIGNVHCLLARSHLYGIVGALGATESILHASGKHHAQAVVPEAVADAQTSDEVRRWHGMTLQLNRAFLEITHLRLVVFSESLVRSLLCIIRAVAGKIISAIFPEIITCSDGCIRQNLEVGWRILHHHIHHATGCIAFHISRQRLGYHEAIHQIRREDIQRNVTVFIIRTWNLHAVYQGVVVALVHASEDGVGSLARCITLHGYTRYSLQNACHVDIRRKLDALLAHHVEHVAGILHGFYGASVAAVFTMTGNHHFAQLLQVFIHRNIHLVFLSHIYYHLPGLVRHIGNDDGKLAFIRQFIQGESTIKSSGGTHVGQLLYSDYGSDEGFTRFVILDYTIQRMCLDGGSRSG